MKKNTLTATIQNKILFFATAVCIVLICSVIFLFSSQRGTESSEVSIGVTRVISGIIFRRFDSMTTEEQGFIISELEPFIRKLAHFTEYAVLGAAIYLLMISADPAFIRRKRTVSLAAAAVFASLDELHQLFVPGRSGMLTDVLIDACGASAGIITVTVIIIVVKHVRDMLSRRKDSPPDK